MKVTTQTNNNSNTTVSLTTFVNKSYKTKKGEDKFRLEPESKKVDMNALVEFIQNMLPNVIDHRNQLKHYRSIVKLYKELFGCIEIDVDFSEKLTVPLKYESQSMHWSHSQIIVHSGIAVLVGQVQREFIPLVSHQFTS